MSEEEFYKKLRYNFFGSEDCKDFKELVKAYNDKDKEIERLNNNWKELRHWVVENKHNENTKEHYLVVDYGELLNKLQELEGSDKE